MLHHATVYGLVLVILTGCSSERVSGDRFLVYDSSGISIAWSEAPLVTEPVFVDPQPVMVVPPEFAAPEHVLYQAREAALLSDGRVVVGNRGTSELLFFSPDGAFLGALGGPGDGPGEFQRLYGLHQCGDDRLVVEELSRLSLIRAGPVEFERNVQISGHLAAGRAVIGGVNESCSRGLMVDNPMPDIESSNRMFDLSVTLYWAAFESGARDSIGTFAGAELFPWELEGRSFPVRPPFGRTSVWAVHPEGVVFGSARDVSYQLIGSGGQVLRIVRWAAPPFPVTDDDWEHFERSREELYPEEIPFHPPRGYLPRPEQKPPYAALKVDSSGRVWVQTYGDYNIVDGPERSSTWWVFTEEGEWIAEVRVPDELEVLAIGDSSIIGVARDELDLEQIQVYRFSLSGGG